MVALTQVAALAAALAGSTSAQFFGMTPKMILALTPSLPPAMVTTQAADQLSKMVNKKYGKVADNSGVSRRQMLTTQRTDVKNLKTIKVRYGPYTVPSMMTKNGLDEGGALWNYADKEVEKPCEECVIFGLTPGLEYANGTNANIDTGSWLHHFVLFNSGPGRVDSTCEKSLKSLPHIAVGTTPANTERIYASGNERMPMWFDAGKGSEKPAGYFLKPADKFKLLVDFMNESAEDRTYWLTMTFDYLEGTPSGIDDVKALWLDVDNCGFSDVHPKQESGKFEIMGKPWTSTVSGDILNWFGHLHDGGVSVTLTKNGVADCSSDATYGGSKEFIGTSPMMNPESATSHISSMTRCNGTVKQGEVWNIKAAYDYDKYKGMRNDEGKQAEIMGITFMYLRKPRK